MKNTISLALLLRKDWRNPEGLARVQAIAAEHGWKLTGKGQVTLSAAVSPSAFRRVFGFAPTVVPARRPRGQDFGARAGYLDDHEITVPTDLSEYVESISIEPPATRFSY